MLSSTVQGSNLDRWVINRPICPRVALLIDWQGFFIVIPVVRVDVARDLSLGLKD